MSFVIEKRRTGHPYWMYDTLQTQPAVAADLLANGWDQAAAAATCLADCERIFLVGIGSSLHAAQAGAAWLCQLTGVDARAVASLDFCLYGPVLRPGDGVMMISHGGGGGYTREALSLVRKAGLSAVVVTGRDSAMPPATVTLTTSPAEVCRCHTAGYSAPLIVLLQVATAMAEIRQVPLPAEWAHHLATLPAVLTNQLGLDAPMQAWAADLLRARSVMVVGAGLHQATADEVALKMQEAVQRPVLAMTIESLAHGPMAALQDGDLVVSVIPDNARAMERQLAVSLGLAELTIPVWGVSSGDRRLAPHALPEVFGPITHLIPMQLLTYWAAVGAGVDPDWNRLGDPGHAAAKTHY